MSDLLYNRPNFLDSYTNKPKNKSRKEWVREKLLNESEEKDIHSAEAASKEKIRRRHLRSNTQTDTPRSSKRDTHNVAILPTPVPSHHLWEFRWLSSR
mgnify:CR=1 FL=1